MTDDLETAIDVKIKPLLEKAMQKIFGITISEITTDISDRLLKTPLADMTVDIKLNYQKAKGIFRRWFIIRMLMLNCGNVSEVARKCAINRRSIHRMLIKYNINVNKLREEMIKREYIKQTAISSMIGNTLKNYEQVLNSKKLQELYKKVPELSKQILNELPEEQLTLKEAEKEFEKRYFQQVLDEHNHSIPETARKISIRQETLYRKLKKLDINSTGNVLSLFTAGR